MKIYNDWSEEGHEKRRVIRRRWISKLENDEALTKATERELWDQRCKRGCSRDRR
jgi:hypothetical protein